MEPFQELEIKWAEWNDLNPAGMVVCSSGTAALHLAWETLDPAGRIVDMCDLNMVACPRSVVLAGMRPRFFDCNDRLLPNTDLIRQSCDNLLITHIYGRKVGLEHTSLEQKDYVVEDLAEAHGIRPNRLTHAACWSFYKNKIVCGEEGGAVWFRDPEHAKLAKQLRSLGFTNSHNFTHVPRGHNYRMSNAHAQLVLASLKEADENIKKRWQVEYWYATKIPREWLMPARDAVWVYDLRIPGMTSEQQNKLVWGLNQRNVTVRYCFKPMTTLDEWRGTQEVSPNALRLSREVIYLPVQPYFTEWDVTRIVNDLMETCHAVELL